MPRTRKKHAKGKKNGKPETVDPPQLQHSGSLQKTVQEVHLSENQSNSMLTVPDSRDCAVMSQAGSDTASVRSFSSYDDIPEVTQPCHTPLLGGDFVHKDDVFPDIPETNLTASEIDIADGAGGKPQMMFGESAKLAKDEIPVNPEHILDIGVCEDDEQPFSEVILPRGAGYDGLSCSEGDLPRWKYDPSKAETEDIQWEEAAIQR